MKKLWEIITWPVTELVRWYKWRKLIKEMRKRDPFIYK